MFPGLVLLHVFQAIDLNASDMTRFFPECVAKGSRL